MGNAEHLANKLGRSRRSGNGFMCCCPAHPDRTASLWIVDKPDGSVHVECKAGCDFREVRKLLGIDAPMQKEQVRAHEAVYDYTDKEGRLLFQKIRNPNKGFFLRRPDGKGGWAPNLEGITEKPLYNLPSVLAAIEADEPIAILEGEKDCKNFEKFTDTIATCNFDGASKETMKPKWREEYSKALTGARVFLLYDNDEAGVAHCEAIIKSITPYVKTLTMIHLPDEFKGRPVKDFSDFYHAGASNEDFNALENEIIKVAEPEKETPPPYMLAEEWLTLPEIPPSPVLHEVFDKGDKVVIIGKSKTRKSFFAQQLAFSLVAARSFLSFPALEKCKVLIVQSEIKKDRYHARCLRMAKRLGIDPGELKGLVIVNGRGAKDLMALIEHQALLHQSDVIIIDPLYKLIEGDENKSEDLKPVLKFFDSLAEKTGAAIVYVHHDKKGSAGDSQLTDRGSGSGILARDFDSAIFLAAHETEENSLVVEFIARNYLSPAAFTVDWMNYAFTTSDSPARKQTSRSASRPKKAKLAELTEIAHKVLAKECLLGITSMGVATFNSKLEDAGIPHKSLSAIKEDLEASGMIKIEKHKKVLGGSGKTVTLFEYIIKESKIDSEIDDEQMPF